jgi:hypothetical protein
MLVRGAEPMEKRQQRGLFTVLAFCWPFAHMFFPALSPDSVDNRITALSELIPLAAAERPSAASQ